MPRGIYKKSESHKESLKKSLMGHSVSDGTRKKMREKSAHNKYWLGKKRPSPSSETRLKMQHSARKGSKNPAWNGGVTSLRKAIRECFEYNLWRTEVFRRDGFVCVACGAKSGKGKVVVLNADHIKSFASILKENCIKTLAEARSCKELWDIRNGRTLCRKCHQETETWGKKH